MTMLPLLIDDLTGYENFVFLETIKTDTDNFKSFLFLEPVNVLQTSRIDEVDTVLKEIERCVDKGFYAAGYVAYEAGYAFEPKLKNLMQKRNPSCPLIWFGIFKNPSIYDVRNEDSSKLRHSAGTGELSYKINDINFNMGEDEYKNRIKQIKKYIHSGDTYQINFTWNIHFSFEGSMFAFYDDLKRKQSVSYSAFIKSGDACILSFSPELFFRRKGDTIITRPMKGTMKRGHTLAGDEENIKVLKNSEKNRAENLMIVDLLRNDVGRLSEMGSVEVSKLFEIEKYETLFQMTSTVRGTLKPGTTYSWIFKNLFPCGSVTGAPKIRSMEIINELEKDSRGVYTGAVGYISPDKEAVFNVAIRTPVIKGNKGRMGIGSGIIWDSKPEEEYKECKLKMKFVTEPAPEFNLIETIRHYNNRYRLLKYHIQRLRESAQYFDFKFDADDFMLHLKKNAEKLDKEKKYKVRILVDKSGNFSIENVLLDLNNSKTGYAALSGIKMDSGNKFLYHKTTLRDIYDKMYKKGREKGYIDLIFTNEKGEVTEGCISNIFIKRNGKFITPPVECGLLNGIMRQYIIKKAKNVIQDIITLDELKNAGNIYLCNSVRGITKIKLDDAVVT